MKSLPRLFAVLAALLIGMLYVFPLWQITLDAPQFPEGVNMYIHIDKIGGDSPGTLQNINILNHYIGMAKIVPESIPELQYFPYVVAGLILFSLVAAMVNKPRLYLTFTIVFAILAVLGIYDFYTWMYEYGHNLEPTAPIKVPGQSYQPPLLGTKMILNFKVSSFPAVGGISMGIALFSSALAWFFCRKALKKTRP